MSYRVEVEERASGQFLWKLVDEKGVSQARSVVYPTKEAAAKAACVVARDLGVKLIGWNPAQGDCCAGATDPVP